MTATQRRGLLWLPAAIFILNDLIRTYVRPVYGRRQYGPLSWVLGWLPNLLAPIGFVGIGMLVVLLLQSQQQGQLVARRWRWWLLLALVVASLVGFIQHEFAQRGSGLYYDVDDIWATVAGTALGALLYWWALLRGPE